MTTERVCVREQKRSFFAISDFQDVIVKAVHDVLGEFQNGKEHCDRFVEGDLFSCVSNNDEISVDNLRLPKCDVAHSLQQLVRINDEANVHTLPDLLHCFAKRCVCLEFGEVGDEIGSRFTSLLVA